MRKRLITPTTENIPSPTEGWLDVGRVAVVEVTSEDQEFPVESAFVSEEAEGWRAAKPAAKRFGSSSTSPKGLAVYCSSLRSVKSPARRSLFCGGLKMREAPSTKSCGSSGISVTRFSSRGRGISDRHSKGRCT